MIQIARKIKDKRLLRCICSDMFLFAQKQNGFCAKGKSETWKAIDTAAGIFDLLYGIESSSLTNWLARDKKTVGRTTCYLNRALRSQRDLSRCYGKTFPLFPYRKVEHLRLQLFVSALLNNPCESKNGSASSYLSLFLHLSRIFRDRAFLFLFFSSLKNFSFFLFFSYEGSLCSLYYFLRYVISGIIEFPSSQ